MDVNDKSLACREILDGYQNGAIPAVEARKLLVALGADPWDARELMAVAMGGDDVVEVGS